MEATRRSFIGGLTAVSIVPASATAKGAVLSLTASPACGSITSAENPELLEAYNRLQAAHFEHGQATEALAWLADEWRHVWPLAPEELLGGANAHGFGNKDAAERDIIGKFLFRDTSALTKRFSRQQRSRTPTTCFLVITAIKSQEAIEFWTSRVPKGRTERALESSEAIRDRMLREYRHKLELAREYEAETTCLRYAAGVDGYNDRLALAERGIADARVEISKIPAFTSQGLRIKAEALKLFDIFNHISADEGGFFGEMARFMQSVSDIHGGPSA